MLRTSRALKSRKFNLRAEHGKEQAVRGQNERLWDRASRQPRPTARDHWEWGRGGRLKGHMFGGNQGNETLSGKFSYHKIPDKIKNMDEEVTTEMWLSRPYLDREVSHFMETGEYIPKSEGAAFDSNKFAKDAIIEDDNGNYIKRPTIKYPEDLTPSYFLDKKAKTLEAKRLKYKLSMKPNVYAADLWASVFKHDHEKRKSEDKINLDFYEKYHEMAVPRNYPKTMPMAVEDWKNWSRVPEFKKYAANAEKMYGTQTEYDPRKFDKGCSGGLRQRNYGQNTNPLELSDRDLNGQSSDFKRVGKYGYRVGRSEQQMTEEEYLHHPWDSEEWEAYTGGEERRQIKSRANMEDKMGLKE